MRALSQRQASACETASTRRCICRCGGALHGSNRQLQAGVEDPVEYVVGLPEEDPHYVSNKTWQPRLPAPVGFAA